MMPILFVLLLSFFGCYGASSLNPEQGIEVYLVDGRVVDKGEAIKDANPGLMSKDERAKRDQELLAALARHQEQNPGGLNEESNSEGDYRTDSYRAAVIVQPGAQQIGLGEVVTQQPPHTQKPPHTQQPRLQPHYVFYSNQTDDTTTVNIYEELPYCVCAPVSIKNGGAVCPVRFCCACNTCGLPRVVVAGCLVTNNISLKLPEIKGNCYDQAGHLGQLANRKATLNLAPGSVGKFLCICGGCFPTVNQNKNK